MFIPNTESDTVAELLASGTASTDIRLEFIGFNKAKPKRWYRKQAVPAHYQVSITWGTHPFVDYYEGRASTPEKAVRSAVRAMFTNDSEPGLL